VNLEEAIRISTSALQIESMMQKLGKELDAVDGVTVNHHRMLDNARQAMRMLAESLRPLVNEE
jgi:hypothetical protein